MVDHEADDDKTRTHVVLTKGTMVSHYRIACKIGAGGMGEVYLAEDSKLSRNVALKFLPTHLSNDEDCRERFKREAQATAKLSHPNVVTIFEVSEYQGRPFFAMEHVGGKSLRDLTKERELDLDEVTGLAIQTLEGLHKAHQSGVTHRDVKPSNIVIDADGRPKLLDFGLAAIEGLDKVTKTGSTLGTVGYMSPEQIQGKDVDQRSDLFSFGVVLYEMVTARLPFEGDNEASVMNAVLSESVEPLSRYKSDVPDELQNIVSKLLEKDASLRYQHADDVITDLKRLRRDSDSSIITPTVTTQTRNTTRYLVPTLIVILLVAMLVFKPWELQQQGAGDASAETNRLAIMYFDNLADPADSQKMGEIATNLLITDLSESRFVQVVSSQRLYDILKNLGREGEKTIDHSTASQIAERAKAKWMLLGSILGTDPQIVMTAQLIEVSSGTAVASQRINGKPGEDIFTLVDKLTVEIKSDLSLPEEALTETDRPVAEVTTTSPEAYRHYLEGVELGFQRYLADAELALKQAITLDSTFAMAFYQLARVGQGPRRRTYLAKALEFSTNSRYKEKLTIEAYHAWVNGEPLKSLARCQEIVKRYPDDKEAHLNMAIFYSYGFRQVNMAIKHYTRAIELDSLYGSAYNALAYCYNDIGDFDKSIWAMNKYIELEPDQANPYDSRGELFAGNGRIDEAIGSFAKAIEIKGDFYQSWGNLGLMHLYKRNYDEAQRCFDRLLESPRKNDRSVARQYPALVLVHQGRFEQALSVLEQGIAADRMEKAETWPKHYQVARIYAELGEIDKGLAAMQVAMEGYRENRGLLVPIQHFYIQMLAEGGRIDEAETALAEWKGPIAPDDSAKLSLWWIAAGCVERAKGDLPAAVEYFGTASSMYSSRGYTSGFRAYLMLAKTQQVNGQLGEAVNGYEQLLSTFSEDRLQWTIESVKLHYYLGTAYEESGWNDKAIEQYETFLDIWKDADSGLVAVDDAKERLAKLKSAP
ncbi:MAG: protein kinase [candidate division Zixibacteria bacterium]|nr:protein kinase [candidate division Zixibacteria bacterium]MDH3938835.1 protein kinase [candidate division Zixibacteria bacterium]